VTHLACYAYGVGVGDGVCLRLEIDKYQILLDCGLKDLECLAAGISSNTTTLFEWADLDLVLCSHAHVDHAFGLLALHEQFPQVPIYASEVTVKLLPLNWPDHNVPSTLCHALPWRSPIAVLEHLTVELIPAGHLPGAAATLLSYRVPNHQQIIQVLYTGDFLLSNMRLAEGLRLQELRGLRPDVLIVEGSYGTSRHPHRRQQENRLMERIAQALTTGKSVVLPVPPIGLGQELLFLLRSHHLFSGRDLTIWVNGQVANGCDAYLKLTRQFPIAVQNFAQHQPLFWDTKVQPQVRYGIPPQDNTTPCIVLTDTQTDLSQFCMEGTWLVLLPESASPNMGDASAPIASPVISQAIMTAETYWLSEHSDGNATLQLIHNLRPQHVLLMHGQPDALANLANLDELSNRYKIHIPQSGSWVELPIADHAIANNTIPEARYEGEVAEARNAILISLPEELMMDPRWRNFADTGIIEAHWQGRQLVIRGVSANAITGAAADTTQAPPRSCFHCQAYQQQRCTNPASPLFQLPVTPEGDCLEFQLR
jgi:Cft2 family RNA processing exonuclease